MNSSNKFTFKIILVGDSGVGKTSILNKYSEEEFMEAYSETVGIDFKTKVVYMEKEKKYIKLNIFDLAGAERFKGIVKNYYKKVDGIVFIYDVTNMTSFDSIKIKVEEVKFYSPNAERILVGNKSDSNKRKVEYEVGLNEANRLGMTFIETSAKSNYNVFDAFMYITKNIFNNGKSDEPQITKDKKLTIKNTKISKKSKCCY